MKRKDIDRMLAAGLISKEQAKAIAEHYHLDAEKTNWLVASLATLAGLWILGGIIMLVSANWQQIPPMVKMGCSMALLLASWVASIRLRDTHPMVSEGLGFVGGGFWLASIALYGQIFQLQNPFVEGCALFFAGIVALPFIVRQRLLLGAVALTSVILLIAMFDTRASDSMLGLRVARCTSRVMDAISLSYTSLLLLVWWLFAEYCRGKSGFFQGYGWIGYPAIISFLAIIQTLLLWSPIGMDLSDCSLWPLICLSLAWCLIPLALAFFRPRGVPFKQWHILVLMSAFLLPLGTLLPHGGIMGIAYVFLYAIALMSCGYHARRVDWINYGSLLILLAGLALFADVLDSYNLSGFSMILSGLFLLAVALFLEQQRRLLLRSIKAAAPAPQPPVTPAP